MPQGPIPALLYGLTAAKTSRPVLIDDNGALVVGTQGQLSALDQTVAALIDAKARRLAKIIIVAPGTTGGAFTLNDSATLGGAAAGNVVWTAPFNGTGIVAGAVIPIDAPLVNGLVLSAVPTAGSPIINIFYDE